MRLFERCMEQRKKDERPYESNKSQQFMQALSKHHFGNFNTALQSEKYVN